MKLICDIKKPNGYNGCLISLEIGKGVPLRKKCIKIFIKKNFKKTL